MSDDAESGKWLKVKARMPNNQKVMGLSDAAFRLYISVSCWCADEMTDGFFKAHVPAAMPRAPQGKKLVAAIKEVESAGLWRPTNDGDYEVNDFLKYNMSRARWEALKAAGAEGGKRSGETRRRQSEAKPEAPASAPARPPAEAGPQHDHDHEERSKKPPPNALTGSARREPDEGAAAALDLTSGARGFVEALTKAWHPFVLGGASDALIRLVGEQQADGATDALLAAAGAHLGRWLSEPDPAGKPRTLAVVSQGAVQYAVDEARGDELLQAAAGRRRAEREQVLRSSVVPRKATPAPMAAREYLSEAQRALERLISG